jgi:DNA-binding Lrp family transcriptional regulator
LWENESNDVFVHSAARFAPLRAVKLGQTAGLPYRDGGRVKMRPIQEGARCSFKVDFPLDFAMLEAYMKPIIKLLLEGGGLSNAQMAQVLNLSETEIVRQLDELRQQRILLGHRPVLNLANEEAGAVRAVIEVRITPERSGGFNRLAERISRFDEVESCYLMSGGYDLLVFVTGSSLQKVAGFVSEKLATVEGVLSTATHFMLRSYKEHGFMMDVKSEETERLNVTP